MIVIPFSVRILVSVAYERDYYCFESLFLSRNDLDFCTKTSFKKTA